MNGVLTGWYGLFVLQTTVDNPDVMLPYFSESRLSAIFFIAFLFLNTILIVNMILALFYTAYKAEVKKSTLKMMTRNF
jgi:hypothetical protein